MSLVRKIRHFLGDGRGNVAIIVALVFLPVLIIAGAAIDLARYERARSVLQDGVDRAALAAAALTQTRPLAETVTQYMDNVDFFDQVQLTFAEQSFLTKRDVDVTAVYPMPTVFLHLIGISTMEVSAKGAATQSRMNLEISLVLDVSISMRDNDKFDNLKLAAADFIDALITPSTSTVTTMSVVPFAGHVNMGKTMFNAAGARRTHNDNSCIDFSAAEYSASGMVNLVNRAQLAHFIGYAPDPRNNNPNGYVGAPDVKGWWCPGEETAINYFSNDPTTLKSRIDGMHLYSATGTNNGMKWGAMLLDPAARNLINTAVNLGVAPVMARGRPADYTDGETVKILVLMTDGAITQQSRPSSQYKYPSNLNLTQISSDKTNETYLKNACTTAKGKGVVVYTIGFEVESKYASQMRDCATTPDHYYPVAGLDIRDAFRSIASSIQSLRLTQ